MIDLHIIENEKIAVTSIATYRKWFSSKSNPFVIFGGAYNYSFEGYENVTIIEENLKGSKKLINLMKRADRIHVHGIFSFWLLGILATHRRLCEKTVWYIWGDDLYCLTKPKSSIINRFHLAVRRKAYRSIRYVATNVIGDYDLLKSLIHKEYEFFELRFGNGYISGIEPYINEKNEHEGTNILVGNSATISNYHLQVFDELSRFQNENIRIYVPLSYGSKTYAGSVIARGKELFGDKFIPLTEFIPRDDYFRLLMSMDVAIFANDRQQAMGNIVALLYAGKKVYMRSDISSWASIHDEYDIGVCDYNSLRDETFIEFSSNPFNSEKQMKLVLDMTDTDKYVAAVRRTLISES